MWLLDETVFIVCVLYRILNLSIILSGTKYQSIVKHLTKQNLPYCMILSAFIQTRRLKRSGRP